MKSSQKKKSKKGGVQQQEQQTHTQLTVEKVSIAKKPEPVAAITDSEDNEWSDLIDSVEKPERALDFFLTPLTLERLIMFGSLISADSFLFTIAFLPFRALWRLVSGAFVKSHAARIDIARVVLIIGAYALVPAVSLVSVTSLVKKSELKLKLVWATLEFLNGMLTDWNTTIIGSFFWALSPANAGRRKCPLVLHFAAALGYLMLHTAVITLYLGVINLAISTSNRAFLGLIFIVQFAEMKSAATKSMSLAKIMDECISDITERFQTIIYVSLLFISNYNFAAPFNAAATMDLASDLAIVYFSELAVDWLKHTSMLNTNRVSPGIYTAKTHALMADFVANTAGTPSAVLGDKSTKTSRSMGFCAIPAVVVTFKIITNKFAPDHSPLTVAKVLGASWIVFVLLKVFTFGVTCVVSRITVFTPIEKFLGITPTEDEGGQKKPKDKTKTK